MNGNNATIPRNTLSIGRFLILLYNDSVIFLIGQGEKYMISIIVPIFHTEKYLEKCILSILNQTYSNIEVLLIDDGTTALEARICDEFVARDSRVKVIHKNNEGLSVARNTGLIHAKGEYIGFVDSDDYIHPRMYEILMNNLINTKSNISICNVEKIYDNEQNNNKTEFVKEKNEIRVIQNQDLFDELSVNHLNTVIMCNKLWKKEVFNKIKFPINKYHEDEFVIHELLYEAKSAVISSAKLYFYLQNRRHSIINQYNNIRFRDAYEAFEVRSRFIENISYPNYLQARVDQVWISIDNYHKCKLNYSSDYMFYREQFFKLIKIKKIWKKAGFLISLGWIVFILNPDLYFRIIKIKNGK